MRKLFVILALFVIFVTPGSSQKNVTTILDELTPKADPFVRPSVQGGKAEVEVSMKVIGFHAIDEASQEMAIDMYLRYLWTDPRLQYTDGPKEIPISYAVAKEKLWFPDLFFPGVRQQNVHGLLSEHAMVRLQSDGRMFVSVKAFVRFDCPMDLRKFPVDTQSCRLYMQSYSSTHEDLNMKFLVKEGKVAVTASGETMVAFAKPEVKDEICTDSWANFPCLCIKFEIKRLAAHYIVTIYVPSFLLMALGGLVFWFPLSALFERAFFTSFLVLSQATILASSQYGTPQVWYMKAIDVWVVAAFIFLCVVLLEVIGLFLLSRGTSGPSAGSFQMRESFQSETELTSASTDSRPQNIFFLHPNLVKRLDLGFRIAYPVAVVLYIIVYACVYHN